MAEKSNVKSIEEARKLSIQRRATDDRVAGGIGVFSWLVRAGELVSPWWSPQRDADLRQFWKRSDHLAGAMYTMESWATTLNFRVVPRDASVKSHHRQAEEFTRVLWEDTEFGQGWVTGLGKGIQDLFGQDNGWFAEVIGAGKPDGPIKGRPVGLAHLDSYRATRTSNLEYPIVYMDTDGRRYKLHRSRVIALAQMSSPIAEMNGVGLCAVSRCINVAQNLIDIGIFKQEKLGSRPARQMIIGQKGITAGDIWKAFMAAEESMDNQGLRRYGKTVVIAPTERGMSSEIVLNRMDLNSAPDGFDERESVTLGMFAISLAFGVEARFLWPASVTGATKADAMSQAVQGRRKGRGQIIRMIKQSIDQKFLPPHLELIVDAQDDEEDKVQAELQNARAKRRTTDLAVGVTTIRVEREKMLEKGDLTQAQFEELELADGRLPGGDDVLSLFHSKDEKFRELLDLGVSNPLEATDSAGILEKVEIAQHRVQEMMVNAGQAGVRSRSRQAAAALNKLAELYKRAGKPVEVNEEKPENNEEEPADKSLSQLEAGMTEHPFDAKAESHYRASLRPAVRGLWTGTLDYYEAYDSMMSSIRRYFREAFLAGAKLCGIAEDELTPEERMALEQATLREFDFIDGLLSAVQRNSRAEGGKLKPLYRRLDKWVDRYKDLQSQAMQMTCADRKLAWRLNPAEHCVSCLKLEGKVKRASYWQAQDVRPQSPRLQCMIDAGGTTVCKCNFEITDEPLSKGPLPRLP